MYYFIHRTTGETCSCEDARHIARREREGWEQVSHDRWEWQRERNDRRARERIAREDAR
jgi:hypothetical protein